MNGNIHISPGWLAMKSNLCSSVWKLISGVTCAMWSMKFPTDLPYFIIWNIISLSYEPSLSKGKKSNILALKFENFSTSFKELFLSRRLILPKNGRKHPVLLIHAPEISLFHILPFVTCFQLLIVITNMFLSFIFESIQILGIK